MADAGGGVGASMWSPEAPDPPRALLGRSVWRLSDGVRGSIVSTRRSGPDGQLWSVRYGDADDAVEELTWQEVRSALLPQPPPPPATPQAAAPHGLRRVVTPLRLRLRHASGAPPALGEACVVRGAALECAGGAQLVHTAEGVAAPAGASPPALDDLNALKHLLAAHTAGYVGALRVAAVRDDGTADVDVPLLLPESVWTDERGGVQHAGLAFLCWHAAAPRGVADLAGECGVVGCAQHPAGAAAAAAARAATLRSLLEELPSLQRLQLQARVPALQPEQRTGTYGLHHLPEGVLRHILLLLPTAKALRAAAHVCRGLRAVAASVAPGLGVQLYAHQQAALGWMMLREAAHFGHVASPLLREGHAVAAGDDVAVGQLPFLVDGRRVCGAWAGNAPDHAPRDCCGGFFCDEPGMGKTVTVLALVLRTRGCRAAVPPDAALPSPSTRSGEQDTPPWYTEAAAAQRRGSTPRKLGPAPGCRILQSRATLVVVPTNLVDHWRWQAAERMARGAEPLRVVVDGGGKHAPDALTLADADVVLTTFARLSAVEKQPDCALFAVRWLRVVLDEGHALSSASALTARLGAALALRAERRWVMTGTPAPERAGTRLAEQAARLQPLLAFLREPVYGSVASGKAAWRDGVLAPLRAGHPDGLAHLRAVLRRLMARACKAHLQALGALPPLLRRTQLLGFERAHGECYNLLVRNLERSLFLADLRDPACPQSLLHPAQAEQCRAAVDSLRLAACVAGGVAAEPDAGQLADSLAMLCDAAHPGWKGIRPAAHDQPGWRRPTDAMLAKAKSALRHCGGTFEACGADVPLALVTPCCHVICFDCAPASRTCCAVPSCRAPYLMQDRPGGPVPQDLIELQIAVIFRWIPDWMRTVSTKVGFVLDTIAAADPAAARAARARSARRFAAVAAAEAALFEAAAAAADDGAAAPVSPSDRHDAALGALAAVEAEDALASTPAPPGAPPPLKCIIYSRWREHLQLFASHLGARGVRFAWLVSHADCDVRASVAAFKTDPSCAVLLMDAAGSHGHDLSVASLVFLAEPLRDAAEENQVISRAHRLGCAASCVTVHTLAMRGTAEERLLHLRADTELGAGGDDASAVEKLQNREVLRSLAFVRVAAAQEGAAAEEDVPMAEAGSDDVRKRMNDVFVFAEQHAKLMRKTAALVASAGRAAAAAASAQASGSGISARSRGGAARLTSPDAPQPPLPRRLCFDDEESE